MADVDPGVLNADNVVEQFPDIVRQILEGLIYGRYSPAVLPLGVNKVVPSDLFDQQKCYLLSVEISDDQGVFNQLMFVPTGDRIPIPLNTRGSSVPSVEKLVVDANTTATKIQISNQVWIRGATQVNMVGATGTPCQTSVSLPVQFLEKPVIVCSPIAYLAPCCVIQFDSNFSNFNVMMAAISGQSGWRTVVWNLTATVKV